MTNTKTSLRQFARLHRDRPDPLGDYCSDLLDDPDFPSGRLSWSRLELYLLDCNACSGAMEAARRFWTEWQGQPTSDAASALLLATLATYGKPFDATTITGWVQDGDKDLLDAMAFLAPRTGKGTGRLTEHTRSRLRRWFDQIEGRQIGGFCLDRDRFGWCRVSTRTATTT